MITTFLIIFIVLLLLGKGLLKSIVYAALITILLPFILTLGIFVICVAALLVILLIIFI